MKPGPDSPRWCCCTASPAAAALRARGERLTPSPKAWCVDPPGHGASPSPTAPPSRLPCAHCSPCSTARLPQVDLAGYSLGARLALGVAVDRARSGGSCWRAPRPGCRGATGRARRRTRPWRSARVDGRRRIRGTLGGAPPLCRRPGAAGEVPQALRARRRASSARGSRAAGRGLGTRPRLSGRLFRHTDAALLLSGALDAKYAAIAGTWRPTAGAV